VTTLREHLDCWSIDSIERVAVAETVAVIASAAASLAEVVAKGALAAETSRADFSPKIHGDGDQRKALDLYANDLFIACLRQAPVAGVASEEIEDVVSLREGAPLVVALDPLDGSNNIDINAPIGTVFSLLPSLGTPPESFMVPGAHQRAAGFVLYGPHTVLVLTLGEGVRFFTLDPASRDFVLTRDAVRIPPGRREYAINASNARHWPLPIRAYVEECLAGADGPRGEDYNTRWLGAVVAESYRILVHGGIYLYPGDARPGYRRGRLRQLYEANPIAMLIEQAGGAACDGHHRILDLRPAGIHEHVPLIFGSPDKVDRVMSLYAAGVPQAGQRPLFSARGLFKS
jgi:fructose-1,6-bisphosphatase I